MSQQRHTLAFEIGVEEMPARFIPEAIDAMGKLAAQHLEDLRLADYERLEVLSTPRRLVLMVYGLPGRQEDGET